MTAAQLASRLRVFAALAVVFVGALGVLGPFGALGALGCKTNAPGIGLSKEERGDNPFANVPSPSADGPKLVAVRDAAPVRARPSHEAAKIGELRLGAVVARSEAPYARSDCDGGWYAVRPRGFVCVGAHAALATSIAGVLPPGPDLARPLPYRYGKARAEGVAVYARAPTPVEQVAAEQDLTRHLARMEADADALLGAAANDVPLDEHGVPTGPPVLLAGGDGIGEKGKRTASSYFVFATDALPSLAPAAVLVGEAAPAPIPLRKGSGVALAGTFVSPGGPGLRRFGVTPDGRVVPADRLRPVLGSTWHGVDLEKVGLPVGFVHKLGVHTFALQRGEAEKQDEELPRRTAVPLTGRFRTVGGVRYEQAREGYWLRSQDLIVVVRRTKLPEFAKEGQKWLDVSLANQTLTAFEGQKPVYATLISSGRDQLRDPQVSASTVRGVFRVRSKHVTRGVDAREAYGDFDINDAPWVLEFEPGYALTGMYWGESVGEAHGFHNIALTPIDARRIFTWSDPPLPEGWHAIYDQGDPATTIVNVRP